MTTAEAFTRIASKCTTTELCLEDARNRLERTDLTDDERQSVLNRLVDEKFIDESRYARAFAHDKLRFNGWGRIKISQALRLKHISSVFIDEALGEIDDEICLEVLRPLLVSKRRTVHGNNDYEVDAKLTRFALSRGFEYALIRQCLDTLKEE